MTKADTNTTQRQKHELLCREGKIAGTCYLATMFLVFLPFTLQNNAVISPSAWSFMLWSPVLYVILLNMILRFMFTSIDLQIAVRALFLGFVQGVSALAIYFATGAWLQFAIYSSFLAFFHFSEFMAIAWSNPSTLSIDSFILNHSLHYAIAAVISWLEFVLEVMLLPEFKSTYNIWLLGVALCLCGELLRKTAIITAASNFTHLLQFEKVEHHQLVTHGIYAYVRHPSYVGWFLWSIGTQIILLNPLCISFYTTISWRFFRDRIFMEEMTLINFFPDEYPKYQQRVPSGLPFIKGCVNEIQT